jgi:lysozyme
MTAQSLATDLLKEREGCKLTAYQDGGGVWTIGYGETGDHVYKGVKWTQEQAEKALSAHVDNLLSFLHSTLPTLTQELALAALVSFIYNLGKGAFTQSTLCRLIKVGKYDEAAHQFDRWVYDNGKKINGLVIRRKIEKEMFMKGISQMENT